VDPQLKMWWAMVVMAARGQSHRDAPRANSTNSQEVVVGRPRPILIEAPFTLFRPILISAQVSHRILVPLTRPCCAIYPEIFQLALGDLGRICLGLGSAYIMYFYLPLLVLGLPSLLSDT